MTANEKLDDICRGVHADLHGLKEALSEFIGLEAANLNAETFGVFFGSLQIILGKVLFLHSARLFDRPKRQYLLRSIPSAIALMRSDAARLAISERGTIEVALGQQSLDTGDTATLKDATLTTQIANYFDAKLAEAHVDNTLKALKTVRDKIIAHPESVDASLIPKPTYAEIDDLVGLGHQFLEVVWRAYCRVDNDSASDAPRRSTISLRRLLQRACIKTTFPPETPVAWNSSNRKAP